MGVPIGSLPHLHALEGDNIEAVEVHSLRETEFGSDVIRGPAKRPGRGCVRVWEEVFDSGGDAYVILDSDRSVKRGVVNVFACPREFYS